MRGSTFCFSHNPAAADRKRAATSKGGRNRRPPRRAPLAKPHTPVKSLSDVEALVLRSLSEFRSGLIDSEVARTVGYLATVAVKIAESVSIERRVEELESKLLQHQTWIEEGE